MFKKKTADKIASLELLKVELEIATTTLDFIKKLNEIKEEGTLSSLNIEKLEILRKAALVKICRMENTKGSNLQMEIAAEAAEAAEEMKTPAGQEELEIRERITKRIIEESNR